MNAPVSLLDVEDALEHLADDMPDEVAGQIEQAGRCRELWGAALQSYMKDALRHAVGAPPPYNVPEYTCRLAYRDLMEKGPMLQHLCRQTGQDPENIKAAVLYFVENDIQGARKAAMGYKGR